MTASYAALPTAARAVAKQPASTASCSRMTWARPRRICERITPEFPRAPISEPWLNALHVATMSSPAVPTSATTDSSVSAMFVPVSPSGTGYTLSRLMASWWARSRSR